MKKVIFCREGEKLSDFETEEKVNDFIKSDRQEWKVGNSLVIDFFRVKIKNKEIKLDNYEFEVENLSGQIEYFNVDENGRSYGWVDSQDIWSNLITKLL